MDTFIDESQQKQNVGKHTIRDILDLIFKRILIFIGLPLLIIAAVVGYTMTLPNIYEASTDLKIEDSNFDNLGIGGVQQDRSEFFSRREQMINSEINVIKGTVVLRPVVEELELQDRWDIGGPDAEARISRTVRILSRVVGVETKTDSWVISISIRDEDPQLAATLANAIARSYMRTTPTLNTRPEAYSFYQEQWQKEKDALDELQAEFRTFKRDNSVVNYDAEVEQKIENKGKYEERLTDVRTEILSKRAKIGKIEDFISAATGESGGALVPIPEVAQDRLIANLVGRLADYRLQLTALRQRYTDEERQVKMLRAQIDEVEEEVRKEVRNILDRERADLGRLQAERNSLQASIAELNEELQDKASVEADYKNLESQIQDKQEIVSDLNKKMVNSLYAGQTDERLGRIKQISPALVPAAPVAPDLRFILIATIPLAFILGLAVIMVLDYFDRTFSSPEDVKEILDAPVLATVNLMDKKSEPLFK